jgi:hypothetical protein
MSSPRAARYGASALFWPIALPRSTQVGRRAGAHVDLLVGRRGHVLVVGHPRLAVGADGHAGVRQVRRVVSQRRARRDGPGRAVPAPHGRAIARGPGQPQLAARRRGDLRDRQVVRRRQALADGVPLAGHRALDLERALGRARAGAGIGEEGDDGLAGGVDGERRHRVVGAGGQRRRHRLPAGQRAGGVGWRGQRRDRTGRRRCRARRRWCRCRWCRCPWRRCPWRRCRRRRRRPGRRPRAAPARRRTGGAGRAVREAMAAASRCSVSQSRPGATSSVEDVGRDVRSVAEAPSLAVRAARPVRSARRGPRRRRRSSWSPRPTPPAASRCGGPGTAPGNRSGSGARSAGTR